jgi:proline iminopeptidase
MMSTRSRFPTTRIGAGPPVLLLHGGPGLNDYLEDLAELLADRLELVRHTQRGVAPSVVDGPFTVAQHVEDAREVLDAEAVNGTVLIGHSWGGHLAGQFAATYPARVRGLISIDGLGLVGDGGWPEFDAHFELALPAEVAELAAEIDRRLQAGEGTDEEAEELMRLSWPHYFADPSSAPAPPRFRLNARAYGAAATDAKADLASGRLAETLRGSEIPALFLRGAYSGFPRAAVEDSAAVFHDGRYVEIPNAGHFVWVEQPSATRSAIFDFLNEIGVLSTPGGGA